MDTRPFTKYVVGLRVRVEAASTACINRDFDVEARDEHEVISMARRAAYSYSAHAVGAPVRFVCEVE